MAALIFISLVTAVVFLGGELFFRLVRAAKSGRRLRATMFVFLEIALMCFLGVWFKFLL